MKSLLKITFGNISGQIKTHYFIKNHKNRIGYKIYKNIKYFTWTFACNILREMHILFC